MTIDQHRQHLRFTAQALRAYAPRAVAEQAQTGRSLLVNRSVEEGIEVNGQKQTYVTTPRYRSAFAKAALNNAGRTWTKEKPGAKGTYGEFRGVQGRESATVNLFYTGRMWTSLHVVAGPQQGNVISALITPSDTESARKLLGNLKRYGEFRQLRPDEIARLRADIAADLGEFFKQTLNRR